MAEPHPPLAEQIAWLRRLIDFPWNGPDEKSTATMRAILATLEAVADGDYAALTELEMEYATTVGFRRQAS